MPPQDSVWLNNSGQTEQGWPEPGHLYQQRPFTMPQPEMPRCPPQSDVELMTKKEVLNFKPVPRLEQVGDIRSKQVDDHKHCIGWCADSALPRESGRMEFSEITTARNGPERPIKRDFSGCVRPGGCAAHTAPAVPPSRGRHVIRQS